MKDSPFYQEGRIVRLGKPQEEHLRRLEREFPLVLPEMIASKLAESLVAEQNSLLRDQVNLDGTIKELNEISSSIERFQSLEAETNELRTAIEGLNESLPKMQSELESLRQKQAVTRTKLVEAQNAGTLKRILKLYNPQKFRNKLIS